MRKTRYPNLESGSYGVAKYLQLSKLTAGVTTQERYCSVWGSLGDRTRRGSALRIAAGALLMAIAGAPVAGAQDPSAQATQDAAAATSQASLQAAQQAADATQASETARRSTQQANQDAAMAAQRAQQQPTTAASTVPPGESRLPHREERAIANARQLEEAKRAAQFRQSGPPTAAPVFSLKPGAYAGSQTVEITVETPSAIIYFTFDDATPMESWLRYTGPITLVNTSTVHAVAWAPMHSASSVSTAAYTLSSPPRASHP